MGNTVQQNSPLPIFITATIDVKESEITIMTDNSAVMKEVLRFFTTMENSVPAFNMFLR